MKKYSFLFFWLLFTACSTSQEVEPTLGELFLQIDGQNFTFPYKGNFGDIDANGYSSNARFLSILRENSDAVNYQSLQLRITNFELDQIQTPVVISENVRLTFRLNRSSFESDKNAVQIELKSKEKDILDASVSGTLTDTQTQRVYKIQKCNFRIQIKRF